MSIKTAVVDEKLYPKLHKFTSTVDLPSHPVIGREVQVQVIRATMAQPVMANAMVIAEAGTGKSALVEETRRTDDRRAYREINLPKILAENVGSPDAMAQVLKDLFTESKKYVEDQRATGSDIQSLVLFIDEFHQLVIMSPVAVEAIKPILAKGGNFGVHVIAATTYDEYDQYIAPNQPLVERFTNVHLPEPDAQATVDILKEVANTYNVGHKIVGESLYREIYDLTQRNMKKSAQPRKSIMVLNLMVGWHKELGMALDRQLLGSVLSVAYNVETDMHIDASALETNLNKMVFDQRGAVAMVARRLHLAIAHLNDETRPRGSFLLAGPSGVGKTELVKSVSKLIFGDAQKHMIRVNGSEYALKESLPALQSYLTRRVGARPNCVLLMDEYEKMHPVCAKLFLQVLDDGELTDDHGRLVSFTNSFIFVTTNAGKDIFREISAYIEDADGSSNLKEYARLIYTSVQTNPAFPDELLGRMDEVCFLNPLQEATRLGIIGRKLLNLRADVRTRHGVEFEMSHKAVQAISSDMISLDTAAGGARDDIRRIQGEVSALVARFINENDSVRGVYMDYEGELKSKTNAISSGGLVISAIGQ